MTREEAINQLKDFIILHREQHGWDVSTLTALDMAIKALDAEGVLDKIRSEIEQKAFDDVNGSKYIFVNRVNQIIDKYKAESEKV